MVCISFVGMVSLGFDFSLLRRRERALQDIRRTGMSARNPGSTRSAQGWRATFWNTRRLASERPAHYSMSKVTRLEIPISTLDFEL